MNIAILTSGGDAPGMNTFLSNFVKLANVENFSVSAFKCGFQGLVENNIVHLTSKDVDNISHLGGSYIKSFRSKDFVTKFGFENAVKNLKTNNIDILVILGGDGSKKGTEKLAKAGIKTIFVPSTVDNDLTYTQRSLGFDSALNIAVDTVDKIKQTMLSLNRIFICEVMGRQCPDLAIQTSIATNACYTIKDKKDMNLSIIFSAIQTALSTGEDSPLIIARENVLDIQDLASKIQERFNRETRASVIGYIQRGTSPSVYDRILANQLSTLSINLIKKDISNVSLGVIDNKVSYINF